MGSDAAGGVHTASLWFWAFNREGTRGGMAVKCRLVSVNAASCP
jgi:hypothetical protein